MKKTTVTIGALLFVVQAYSQTANGFYRIADSLAGKKDFKNAAIAYSEGIKTEGKNASLTRYRSAAAAWNMSGLADSAFFYLDQIAASEKINKTFARNIEYGEDFSSLTTDKRWKAEIEKINSRANQNGYPQEEFIYGRKDGMALTLICVKPKVKSNGKGIIYVISGNWISGYNGIELNTSPAEQFLKKGYTVFGVIHGSQPRFAIPDEINDIKRSVRYVRYNAAKFGIDPDHIGITGTSAGGHLSLMVATADENINKYAIDPVDRVSSRVQAAAVLFPPTDLMNWGGTGMNFVNAGDLLKPARVVGAVDFKIYNEKINLYEQVTDTATRNKIGREISPINYVSSDDPPVFIIHGDADPIVPLQQSRAIIAKFDEAKVPERFIIKKGGRHNGDDMMPEWQEFVDWFDKYLK